MHLRGALSTIIIDNITYDIILQIPWCIYDLSFIILVHYSDKFMRNILMHLRLVIKYVQGGGGGGWDLGIKKHSFYKGLFYGTLPLFNEGWSFHFLPMEN